MTGVASLGNKSGKGFLVTTGVAYSSTILVGFSVVLNANLRPLNL